MMNFLRRSALVAVAGLVVQVLGVAQEQLPADRKTTITIDQPVEIPGSVLQPGTYVIRRLDMQANRHIVQFFDKGETHIINTVLAIPNARLKPTGKTVLTFWEVPAGQPKALRAWFYPGDNDGQEFAYPKDEADRISASNNGAKVPVTEEKQSDLEASAQSSTSASSSAATANTSTPAPAAAPAPVEVATAAPEQSAPSAPVAVSAPQAAPAPASVDTDSDAQRVNQPATDQLPATASNVPLFVLFGILAVAGALALNFAYHRA